MRALFYNDNGQEYEVTDAETGERIVGVQAFSEKREKGCGSRCAQRNHGQAIEITGERAAWGAPNFLGRFRVK